MYVVTLKADRYPAKRQAGDEKKQKQKILLVSYTIKSLQ